MNRMHRRIRIGRSSTENIPFYCTFSVAILGMLSKKLPRNPMLYFELNCLWACLHFTACIGLNFSAEKKIREMVALIKA